MEPNNSLNVAVGTYSRNNTKSGYQNVAVEEAHFCITMKVLIMLLLGIEHRDNNASYNTGLGRHALEQNINGITIPQLDISLEVN